MIFKGVALSASLHSNGIAELEFDLQGESVNKLDRLTLNELRHALDAIKSHADVRALLITSAKPMFIIGADITEFTAGFKRPAAEIMESVLSVNRLFCDLEDLPMPSAVAISGMALGGGLELCLTTDFRVISETARIGLPEVKLGLFPGYGGTVRLPRLAGLEQAIAWITSGEEQGADAALKAGAVDAVAREQDLLEHAHMLLIQALAGEIDYLARRRRKLDAVAIQANEAEILFENALHAISPKNRTNFPASSKAITSIALSYSRPRCEALEVESRHFVDLACSPQAASLIGLFLNQQALRKASKTFEKQARPVRRAAVLGAGIMGGNIASLTALHGYPSVMKDIREDALRLGMNEGSALLGKRVARQQMSKADMQETLVRIQPTLDYARFADVDFVIEAVVENPKIKQAVLAETESQVSTEAILTSNTSTISVNMLAKGLRRPENFCGMHFFNPVHLMPLVEVIRAERSSEQTISTTVALASKLGKTPIVVNDCPGFLVNRILFAYIGGFVKLLQDGVDFQQIDKAMETFGWPMGPAYLLDVIGIDTSHHCMSVLAEGYPTRMRYAFRNAVAAMYESNRLGQKNRQGFYRYEPDASGRLLKSADPRAHALVASLTDRKLELSDAGIVARMMVPLCLEAVHSLEENIVASATEVDMGAVLGISFPSFRGGPLRHIDNLGVRHFVTLADSYIQLGGLYQVTAALRRMADEEHSFF